MSNDIAANRLILLLGESRWLLLAACALYFAITLYGYHPADPAWSHTIDNAVTQNPGGALGAYLADILFYLFGFSAWWLVVFMLQQVWMGYRRLREDSIFNRRALGVSAAGFTVLLLVSSALEYIRMYSLEVTLPLEPGGMIGILLGGTLMKLLGFTGATLFLLALMAVTFSLFSGLSWLRLIDWLGESLEQAFVTANKTFQDWQDRRMGLQAVNERAVVTKEKKKKRIQKSEPSLHIEMPVAEVPPSKPVAEPRQPTLFSESSDSSLPSLALLDKIKPPKQTTTPEMLEFTSRVIEHKLGDFGVEVKVVAACPGPVITRYEIEPAVGVKGSQIINLGKDLARALAVVSIRIVETIPGKNCMALELPNVDRQTVSLNEILSSGVYADKASPLTLALGKDIAGKPVVADLAKMPHVLVAGTTGSGKSVAVNAMILSLLYKSSPQQVKLLMVDPKMLELSVYEGIPHLLAPVITDMRQAASGLNWCVQEMEKRYKLMASVGVRNIAGFNEKIREAVKDGKPLTNPFSLTPDTPEALEELPLIVVFIDELADLMMVVGKKVEELIARLAQKARAAGMHLVLATQRPSVDVITGLIKANVPTRIAFQVSSKIDSRTILDQMGAESLLGQGDMLYLPPGTGYPQRVHGAFVSDQEVHKVAEHLKAQGEPQYIEGVLDAQEESADATAGGGGSAEADPLYDKAVAVVLETRRASISMVQRRLSIGYNRAARLVEQMEAAGLVSAQQSNGNREILVPEGQQP